MINLDFFGLPRRVYAPRNGTFEQYFTVVKVATAVKRFMLKNHHKLRRVFQGKIDDAYGTQYNEVRCRLIGRVGNVRKLISERARNEVLLRQTQLVESLGKRNRRAGMLPSEARRRLEVAKSICNNNDYEATRCFALQQKWTENPTLLDHVIDWTDETDDEDDSRFDNDDGLDFKDQTGRSYKVFK